MDKPKAEHTSTPSDTPGRTEAKKAAYPSDEAIEKMDRAELVRAIDDLGIAYDVGANEDALRATLRRAEELVTEREAREAAEAGE